MTVTDDVADRLLRLPLWAGLPEEAIAGAAETLWY
jgi:hypothetical protein